MAAASSGPDGFSLSALSSSGGISPSSTSPWFSDHPAGHRLADLHELRIVLQHLPGNIERKILAVDHAADEAQIGRQQIGIVGDEDAADIELHLPLARRLEQVERLCRRREQKN